MATVGFAVYGTLGPFQENRDIGCSFSKVAGIRWMLALWLIGGLCRVSQTMGTEEP